jgi:hypothetical protein
MSDQYFDNLLIECNRLASNAKGDNNARWVTNLNDTIHLRPGDKVSVYSTFISERGSGQLNSVEVKGNTLKTTKDFTYTVITDVNSTDRFPSTDVSSYIEPVVQNVSNVTKTLTLKDNEINLVINFYKTMDLLNYIQLPRRFQLDGQNASEWNASDSIERGAAFRGAVPGHPTTWDNEVNVNDIRGFLKSDYEVLLDTRTGETYRSIIKNDNSKFTIFQRAKLLHKWENNDSFGDLDYTVDFNFNGGMHPPYAMDPEYTKYYMKKELINLSLPKGYNGADYIGKELSRQLNQAEIFDHTVQPIDVEPTTDGSDLKVKNVLTKLVKSKTYQPFDCCDAFRFTITNSDPTFENALYGGDIPILTAKKIWQYYRNYNNIAIKRPEIYEAGQDINIYSEYDSASNSWTDTDQGIFGMRILNGTTAPATPVWTPDPNLFAYNNQGENTGVRFAWYSSPPFMYEKPDEFLQGGIILSIRYNRKNLALLKKYIDAQEEYPELKDIENMSNLDTKNYGGYSLVHFEYEKTKFFHVNALENASMYQQGVAAADNASQVKYSQLGSSFYDLSPGVITHRRSETDENARSVPLFFYYDETKKDTYYEPLNKNASGFGDPMFGRDGRLTYGCFGYNQGYVMVFPNLIQNAFDRRPPDTILNGKGVAFGLPRNMFPGYDETATIQRYPNIKIGFDKHWNAFSTCAIALHNGFPVNSYIPTKYNVGNLGPINHKSHTGADQKEFDQLANVNKLYCGADVPTLEYDNTHFRLRNLHTPLLKGDFSLDFNDPAPAGANQTVYKMNPQQFYNNYTPTQMPYSQPIDIELSGESATTITQPNMNAQPFTIFDTSTGIFIDDAGFDKDQWEDSLWSHLGFRYEQFNGSINGRIGRIDASNSDNMYNITTNADITALDTKSWGQNFQKRPLYDGSVVISKSFKNVYTGGGQVARLERFMPDISLPTESIVIRASEFPIQMTKGYFTIRSDIINNLNFHGGKSSAHNMPIVSIVDKMHPEGDFYFGTESSIQFTITKPTVISSVDVSIHDPNGDYALVSNNSAVIFKIEKRITTSFNVAREIVEAEEKRNKGKM